MRRILCFGEVLWDLLPDGRSLGGAPLNVAFHLRQLGQAPAIVSAVGGDAWGDEARAAIQAAGIDDSLLTRRADRATGTAEVQLDACGQAVYRFPADAAWDAIAVDAALAGPEPAVIVFGTLALRDGFNRVQLVRLLDGFRGSRVVCDLNLRPPFDDLTPLQGVLSRVDLLKVNAEEARRLTGFDPAEEAGAVHAVRERFQVPWVCATLGAGGAVLVDARRRLWRVPAPVVEVADTVGAGDAFTAGLIAAPWPRDGADFDWTPALNQAVRVGAFVASRRGAQPRHESAMAGRT